MIRGDMIRVLLDREFRRLQKNPSALMLIGLLTAVAILIATSQPVADQSGTSVSAGTSPVVLVYEERTEWIDFLLQNLPESPEIRAVPADRIRLRDGRFRIPRGWSAVRISRGEGQGLNEYQIHGRYRGESADTLKPFYDWFWPMITFYHAQPVRFEQSDSPLNVEVARNRSLQDTSVAELFQTELIGSMLVLMVQFFSCCHLLVSFTSQDRERGTLMALALSPARMSEILLARFLFHLTLAVLGSTLIVAVLQPEALLSPLFWLVMLITSVGLMCVGMCISAVARTQSSAGLLALCYMLAGALLFYLASQYSVFQLLKRLTFESYSFPLLYAALKAPVGVMQVAGPFSSMTVIVGVWLLVARQTFYRSGWR